MTNHLPDATHFTPDLERRRVLRIGFSAALGLALLRPAQRVRSAELRSGALVLSFSWYENVAAADLRSAAVDAVTGASLLAQGLTTRAARWIAEAERIPHGIIRAKRPYPADYDACLDQAVEEKVAQAFPKVEPFPEDVEGRLRTARLLYLVFPNWSYTLPRALSTVLARIPTEGMKIAPLCVHGTGGLARTIVDLRRAAPKAEVLAPLSLEREEVPGARERILSWARACAD